MSEFSRYGPAVALAIALGLGASACGGKKSSEAIPGQLCRAERPVDWTQTPPGIDPTTAAKDLGVTESEIINGSLGAADCSQPVSEEQINSFNYVVRVAGEGDKCLVMDYSQPPRNNESRRHVIALCAGPESPDGTTTSATF